MSKSYDYALVVWLRLEAPCTAPELREYLEAEYQVLEVKAIEESESDDEDGLEFSIQLQLTFYESQMEGSEPTEKTISELHRELSSYLGTNYQLESVEILDDALTSFLLAERDELD